MIYATARLHRCDLVTADADFRGLPGRRRFSGSRPLEETVSGNHRKKKPEPGPILRRRCCGRRVTLRPSAPADADAARRIGLHPEILRFFGDQPEDEWRELTPEESEELLGALASTGDRVTWVVDAGSGFIGSASLHSFGGDGTTAAYAVGLLTPDVLGHGLGTEVTRLVLAHAFDDLGLRELTVRVLEFNSRAIGCYARCGFSPAPRARRGHARRHLLRGRDHAPGRRRLPAARRDVAPSGVVCGCGRRPCRDASWSRARSAMEQT